MADRFVVLFDRDDTPACYGTYPYNEAFALADGFDDVYLARVDAWCQAHEDEPDDGCLRCRDAEVERGDAVDRAIDDARSGR